MKIYGGMKMRKRIITTPLSLLLSVVMLVGCGKKTKTDKTRETTVETAAEEVDEAARLRKIYSEYDRQFYRDLSDPSPARGYNFSKIFTGELRCSQVLAKRVVTDYSGSTPFVVTYEYGDGKLKKEGALGAYIEYTYSGNDLVEERSVNGDYELVYKYSYEDDLMIKEEIWQNGEWISSYELSYEDEKITKIDYKHEGGDSGELVSLYEDGLLVKYCYDDSGELMTNVEYFYDKNGNLVKFIQYGNSLVMEYTYDENGLVTHVVQGYCDQKGNITDITLEADIKYGTGDQLMQSLTGTTYFSDGTSIDLYTECIYDEFGRIVSYKSNHPSEGEVEYKYEYVMDDKDRLVQSIKTNAADGSLNETVDYYYYD